MNLAIVARPLAGLARLCAFAAAALILTLAVTPHAYAHGDHGPAASAAGAPSPRTVATSESYQFVAIAEGEALVIYLDRAADNAPVTEAKIEVTLDGKPYMAELQRNGTYEIIAPQLKAPGTYEVLASITEGGKSDLLVGSITIPKPDGHADAAHTIWDHLPAALRPIGGAFANWKAVLGAALGLGAILVFFKRRRKIPASGAATVGMMLLPLLLLAGDAQAHEGHDHGPQASSGGNGPHRRPDGTLFLPKPTQRLLDVRTRIVEPETAVPSRRFAGRVIANPNRSGVVQSTISGRFIALDGGVPPIGTRVKAGDLLGRVAPSFASIDASQMAQTMAELEQQITIARAKLSRIEPLLRTQAVPVGQVDDARLTLEGLLKRRSDLAVSKAQPEDLRAPVAGVIAVARVMSGQVINPSDQVFQIIDSSSLMVEALVFGVGGLGDLGKATAVVADGRPIKLRYIGRSRALQQQYAQVQFAVVDGDSTLDVGLPVKVVAETGAPVTGIILPRAALTQAPNGQTVVFVQKEPEIFEPKAVRFEAFDAERVRILGGIEPRETVVVQGAPLVAQVR